jgi:ABC-type transport system involved in cytochrome bd biosynthesis fused ATPase/permease subunit
LKEEASFQLRDISFDVKPGELTAIVGQVGCGKSSILMALLGEMPKTSGGVVMNGRVFYVAQEPWIFSATIKQNILFGKPYDKIKFNEIISVCALKEVYK